MRAPYRLPTSIRCGGRFIRSQSRRSTTRHHRGRLIVKTETFRERSTARYGHGADIMIFGAQPPSLFGSWSRDFVVRWNSPALSPGSSPFAMTAVPKLISLLLLGAILSAAPAQLALAQETRERSASPPKSDWPNDS